MTEKESIVGKFSYQEDRKNRFSMTKLAQTESNSSKASGQPPKSGSHYHREKTLNIIYFMDSKKTRTIKIPVEKAYLALGFLGAILIWCVVSGILVLNLKSKDHSDSLRIRSLLSTIYEFQVKGEDVFDKAYPNSEHDYYHDAVLAANVKLNEPEPAKVDEDLLKGDAADAKKSTESLTLAAKNLTSLQPEPDVNAPINQKLRDRVTPTPNSESSNDESEPQNKSDKIAALPVDQSKPSDNFDVVAEKIKANVTQKGIDVQFSVRNNLGQTTEGYVYGIAQYESSAGNTQYVTAPMGVGTTPDGKAVNKRSAYLYRIKYSKGKTFSFPRPDGKGGSFKSLKIFVTDSHWDIEKGYDVPIEDKFAKMGNTQKLPGNTSDSNEMPAKDRATEPLSH